MIQTIYTDASHKGDIITLGIYNDTTGLAIAHVIDALPAGNNTDYGELKAVQLASTMLPDGGLILSDSRTIVDVVNSRRTAPEWMQSHLPDGSATVEWVSRNQNVIADWLSRSVVSVQLQLPTGLGQLQRHRNKHSNQGREEWQQSVDERCAVYANFLNNATLDNIRAADDWMLQWLLNDARVRREREERLQQVTKQRNDYRARYIEQKRHVGVLQKRLSIPKG